MAGIQHGQASVEHMVVLGAILFVSLAAAAMIFTSQGGGSATAKSESDSYWRTAAPFSIAEASQPSGGDGTTAYIRLQNRLPEYLQFHNLTLTFSGASASNATELVFPNSRSELLTISSAPMNCSGREGSTVQYDVLIIYDQGPLVYKVQEGSVPLVIKCT